MDATLIREWEWDASHTPLPLTPSFGSVYPGWMEAAMRVTFREFGMLPAGIDMRLRDGYAFVRVKPVGLPVVPPAWIAAPAMRLWWLHPAVAQRVRAAVRRMRADHSTALLRRWETRWRRDILAEQAALRGVQIEGLSDRALADHLGRVMARTGRWVIVHFLLHGAISIPLFQLERFLHEQPSIAHLRVEQLVQGSSRASSAPARALRDVAAPLRGRAELVEQAAALPAGEALALLRGECGGFAAALDGYLARFGRGIAGRYEFIVPTLDERPEVLVPAILRAAREGGAGAPEADEERIDRLIEQHAAGLKDAEVRRHFRSLVVAARRAYAVRDDNVQITFLDAFGLGRAVLLEAGRRLATRGAFAAVDDAFFLAVPETVAVLRGERAISPVIPAARRRRWSAAIANPPPRGLGRTIPLVDFRGLPDEARTVNLAVIRYMREIMAAPDVYGEPVALEAEVRGVGAVRGTYTGVARVLRGEEEFDRLAAGEVLVCAITSPAWAPILPLAGALVTDHGGVLSHPAVIAREFGIPAVVATRRATRVIPDGALVEVDGSRGVVRILQERPGGDV
jgi:rifampicin phosphotransferase